MSSSAADHGARACIHCYADGQPVAGRDRAAPALEAGTCELKRISLSLRAHLNDEHTRAGIAARGAGSETLCPFVAGTSWQHCSAYEPE